MEYLKAAPRTTNLGKLGMWMPASFEGSESNIFSEKYRGLRLPNSDSQIMNIVIRHAGVVVLKEHMIYERKN